MPFNVQYETYQSNAAEVPIMRRWLFGGLMLSLLLHAGLFVFFYQHRLEGFGLNQERLAPPRVFNLKRVAIPDLPENAPEKVTITEKKQGAAPITLPQDRPEVQEITIAPQIQELPKQTFTEKPKVEAMGLDKIAKNDAASRAEMDKELSSFATALLKEGPKSPRQAIIPIASGKGAGAGSGTANVNIPGMATLDQMISKTGSLHAGDKAGMPGGALFDYDKYDLRPEAVEQLRKLGTLIQKNPRATFSIEGHTDSFGTPEYNQKLSELRAEAVKDWLVQNFRISPDRIQTRGFGNTRPIVSGAKSQEEQAPNRRVELVVRTNRK